MKNLLIQAAKRTGLVNVEQLTSLLDQNAGQGRLDEALLNCPYFTEDVVLKLFAESLGWEYFPEIPEKSVPSEFIQSVPPTYAQHHFLIGVKSEDSNGELTVVLSRPLDTNVLDNVSKMTGMPVRPAVATRAAITAVIDVAYEQRNTVIEEVAEELDSQNLDQLVDEVSASDDLLDVVNRPPVIRLVNDILFRALQLRASDIHVHPYETKIQIRYRIDGILYDVLTLNRNVLPLITSRIKVMAGMDIAERRMPQDGRSSVRLGQREVDLRVSTVPTSFGERSVLRLLDKSTGVLALEELGLWPEDLKKLDSLLHRAHGVIFVTGPTGSGKSTSLYAYLNRINSAEKNVLTIEDPIEYQLEGISQIQVANKKGMTFATSLRHVLRQDPDVIMVGEVRDIETARMAIQSSLTGHLVFSTLHTNDSAGAVSRLLDLGVEPYLVSSSLIAIIAQRLVRRVCPDCKRPMAPAPHELRDLGLEEYKDATFFVGEGCSRCFQTGYRGRTGIYEVMLINEAIQEMIYRQETAGQIKRLAVQAGMQTLRMDGARKVLAGITTLPEVLRVTQADVS
ncbi:MAG: type II secretion system ATPase GspE [Sedimentisphaerales bacterium]|jgi:general secretion pathway protein E|nr:type II secretion system ATPase GspE [Sedimentisphaerales bacterium]NLZ06317.1 type II secretion system ATPase GspE [Phycisphaerae bacterium]HNY79079.1 type II secretion system ATPase GspE [Sedimentisphaerales bacterium]HOC64429.1 type II secretion system ATPase GspE [Sedimentisphaerales bacterium]HOH65135.1 type II secretion system ATPase GspE [Sedimentisphaerales bacterium]